MGAKKRAIERQKARVRRYLMIGVALVAIVAVAGAVVLNMPRAGPPVNNTVAAYAIIHTASGEIVFRFAEDKAPITCANFIRLVQGGYYNGLPWHRVVAGFVIQTGNKPSDPRPPIPLELSDLHNDYGTVGVARTEDPNSGSTQFYINTGQNSNLDPPQSNPGYAVFGVVTRGMDVAARVTQDEIISTISFVRQATPP